MKGLLNKMLDKPFLFYRLIITPPDGKCAQRR